MNEDVHHVYRVTQIVKRKPLEEMHVVSLQNTFVFAKKRQFLWSADEDIDLHQMITVEEVISSNAVR